MDAAPRDPLSDVLRSIRLAGATLFVVDGAATFAAEAPPARAIAERIMPGVEHVAAYHAVVRGACFCGVVGEAPVRVEAGDVVVFPHGDPHVFSSAPGMRDPVDPRSYVPPAGTPLPFHVRRGEGPPEVQLVCGFLGCDVRPFNPLLASLPRLLKASDRGDRPGGALRTFMEVALEEATGQRPGAESVLARLSELMFVEVLRRHLEALAPDRTGWLAGLRDEHVGRALALLHATPGRAWSLPSLSSAVGLSRSSLADRFTHLVGEPPMQYLARWRMQVAAGRLSSTSDGLAAIAGDVGYGSEAAFNRAFKKLVGVPPATWRRRARAAAP